MTRPALFRKRTLQLALVGVLSFVFLGADVDARFNSIGHKMMCRCGCNQILLECNHVGCEYSDRMRGELMVALNRGDSDDLVLQAFVQKYGATVLAAPSAKGFNWVAWITPFVALVLGLGLAAYIIRTWRRRPAPAPAAGVPGMSASQLDQYRQRAHQETEL
jgi:cytochrome c-type biogenesis protein CcmH